MNKLTMRFIFAFVVSSFFASSSFARTYPYFNQLELNENPTDRELERIRKKYGLEIRENSDGMDVSNFQCVCGTSVGSSVSFPISADYLAEKTVFSWAHGGVASKFCKGLNKGTMKKSGVEPPVTLHNCDSVPIFAPPAVK